jgi:chromosome segregation ATPase
MSAYEHNARLFMEEYKTTIKNLRNDLQEAQEDYIELQQIHDDTMQEMNAMEDIIAYQNDQLPQMYDQNMKLKAELSELKCHLSDVYDKNRRLCLDLEQAEKEAEANTIKRWGNVDRENFALKQEAAVARAQADNAIEDAINCRRTNDSLLDQLQAAEAKLAYIRMNHFGIYSCMIEDMNQAASPRQSAPTPQQGETVPPRPMWSRYRSE